MEVSDLLPSASPHVIYRSLSDGGVLFSTGDEVYFGLNKLGAQIWDLLPPKLATLGQLFATLQARHPETDPDVIRADAGELLQELAASGLVVFPERDETDAEGADAHNEKADPASAA
ncbi:MAG: PqqD family protein [Gemmatimonadaceae bacterium]